MTFTFIDTDGEKAEQNPCLLNFLLKINQIEDFFAYNVCCCYKMNYKKWEQKPIFSVFHNQWDIYIT